MRLPTLLTLLLAAAIPAQSEDLYDLTKVRSLYIQFSSANWYSQLVANRTTGAHLQGDVIVDSKLFQQIGVRMVGGDSFDGTASTKKPHSIKMDAFTKGQDLYGYDNINLHNGFNDPTMMREVISYEILREYMPAPRANWVDVYVNNVYWGLYINIQQVDKGMISDWFKGNDGNRYLAEPTAAAGKGKSALQWLGTTLQNYQDAYDLKTGSPTNPYVDLQTLCNVLNNSTQLSTDLPQVFEVDRALWYLAHFNLVSNLNGYNPRGNGYYIYHDEQFDTLNVLPWDMGGAFGASSSQTVSEALNFDPFEGDTRTSRPMVSRLFSVAEWRSRYVHHMKTILADSLDWTSSVAKQVSTYQTLIDPIVQADPKKLYSYQDFLDNITKAVVLGNEPGYGKVAPGLQQFCDSRAAYVNTLAEFQFVAPVLSDVKVTPSDPKPNTVTNVTAKVTSTVALGQVTAHYRGDGGYMMVTMYDDGNHGDGGANDGVFGGTIPATVHTPGAKVEYFVGAASAAASGGAVTYLPAKAANDPMSYVTRWAVGSSPAHINEFLAINNSTNVDENKEYEDWVEIYNKSSNPLPVGGMFLTDNVSNPTKWEIPANTSIPGDGTILIWCDEDKSQGPLHANFKLAGAGEEIILFDTDGATQLSRIQFGQQTADVSIGWREDGSPTQLVAYRKYNGSGRGPSYNAKNDPGQGKREFWPVDHAKHTMYLEWIGSLRIGQNGAVRTLGSIPLQPVILYLSPITTMLPLGGGLTLMLGPMLGPIIIPTSQSGQGVQLFSLPNDPTLVGKVVYFQVGGNDSNGLTLTNCAQVTVAK
ncbi:MAG: CotH kinase family protein [Planctomycetota bacterium]|nr:CotH kinase family protein [Planctomycetota bacterium]